MPRRTRRIRRIRRIHRPAAAALSLAFCLSVSVALDVARGEDWPQWRGPDRTGISKETGLLRAWPDGGPKLLWAATDLGAGFSTPSVARGVIYLVGTVNSEQDEHLMALRETSGELLWKLPIGQSTGGHAAPRSTPTADGNLIYVISSDGKLMCADITRRSAVWTKDLRRDFGGQHGNWAYAESPLIDGDTLVCTPGGDQATIVALNKKSGDVIWKATLPAGLAGEQPQRDDGRRRRRRGGYATAGYSSAIVAEIDGVRQYIQFLSGGVVAVAAKDGTFLWHYNEPANTTANCSTPIYHDGAVFAASAYSNGGGRADISRKGDRWAADQQYFVKSMQNHHGGMVLIGDHIYGTGGNSLICINYKSGDIAWQDRSVGKGSVVYADGHLYVRSEGGPIALVEATPEAYKEKGRFNQPQRSNKAAWPHPVVANGRMLIRDWDKMFCYEVKK